MTFLDAVLDRIALVKNDSLDETSDEFYYCVDAIDRTAGRPGSRLPLRDTGPSDRRLLRRRGRLPRRAERRLQRGGGGGGVAQINEYRSTSPAPITTEAELFGEPDLGRTPVISIGDGPAAAAWSRPRST